MTLLSQLTDDQFALIGCGGALFAAFAVMAVSYHVGVLVRRCGTRTPEVPGSQIRPRVGAAAGVESELSGRRAA